jgi:hypothetical protein
MEKWNEICYLINRHKKTNSDEKLFQNEIESIFEKLGWSRFKNEIISTQKLRVGSVNTIIPDITIKLDGKSVFVVELKHPNFSSTQNQADQLFSYMRQLKLDFGILIDKSFHVYYDEPTDDEKPIKIYETEFIENSEEASNFIKLLEKQNFDKEKLTDFCEEKLETLNNKIIADEIVKNLEEQGEQKLFDLLINSLKADYNETIIENVVNNLNIIIKRKSDHSFKPTVKENYENLNNFSSTKSEKLPIEFIPEDKKLFTERFLEIGKATIETHYTDGRIEYKIWEKDKFNEKSSLTSNVRSRPEAKKGKWKELGIAKVVYKINE